MSGFAGCRGGRRPREPGTRRPGPAPAAASVPTGPEVRETSRREAKGRTYQDLLKDAHDAPCSGTTRAAARRHRPRRTDPDAPRGGHVQRGLAGPTAGTFGWSGSVVRSRGASPWVASPRLSRSGISRGTGRHHRAAPGRRGGAHWASPRVPAACAGSRGACDARLGRGARRRRPKRDVPARDRLMRRVMGEGGGEAAFGTTEHRFRDLRWLDGSEQFLVTDYDRDRRWTRTELRDLAAPARRRVISDRSVHDRYGDGDAGDAFPRRRHVGGARGRWGHLPCRDGRVTGWRSSPGSHATRRGGPNTRIFQPRGPAGSWTARTRPTHGSGR